MDCEIYGLTSDHYSVTLRRYAGMALTNLTFGDVANKVWKLVPFWIRIYYFPSNIIILNITVMMFILFLLVSFNNAFFPPGNTLFHEGLYEGHGSSAEI